MSISIEESDGAFNLNMIVHHAFKDKIALHRIVKRLIKEVDSSNAFYITPGCINVALVLTEGKIAGKLVADANYEKLISKTKCKIQELLKDVKNKSTYCVQCKELIEELNSLSI